MTRPVGNLNVADRGDFARFVSLEVEGYSTEEITQELWGEGKDGPHYGTYTQKLSRWRKNPDYNAMWMEYMGKLGRKLMSEGIRKLRSQVRSGEPWLENKAANDVVNFAKGRVFGDDEKTITVKFEGMPELGTPNQPERLEE